MTSCSLVQLPTFGKNMLLQFSTLYKEIASLFQKGNKSLPNYTVPPNILTVKKTLFTPVRLAQRQNFRLKPLTACAVVDITHDVLCSFVKLVHSKTSDRQSLSLVNVNCEMLITRQI